jgi:hypothetical protein
MEPDRSAVQPDPSKRVDIASGEYEAARHSIAEHTQASWRILKRSTNVLVSVMQRWPSHGGNNRVVKTCMKQYVKPCKHTVSATSGSVPRGAHK